MSKLIYFAVALSLLGSLVVVGCAPEEEPTAPTTPAAPTEPTAPTAPITPVTPPTTQKQYGGTLRLAKESGAYNPGFPQVMNSTFDFQTIIGTSIQYLFRVTWDLNLDPWLATGYTTDYAAKTVTITLRKGVKFQDDTDFNAAAVKWNLEQAKLAAVEGSKYLKSIDVIDDYTLRISLSEWDSTFFTCLGQNLGGMYSPTAYEKNGAAWARTNPVGTGPFKQTYFEPQVSLKYKKWDGYWQEGKPYLDAIECTTVPDKLTRELALRNKEFDGAYQLEPMNFPQLEKDGYNVWKHAYPSGGRNFTPDSANPASPFADVRVRQAASYAIDREAINNGIYKGLYTVPNQYASQTTQFGYNPDVVGYPYNPTKAKDLLAEAGYPTGFKTKMQITSTSGADQSMGVALQAQLKAVGIDAELELCLSAKLMAMGLSGEKWTGVSQAYDRTGAADPLSCLMLSYYVPKARVMMLKPKEWLDAVDEAKLAPDREAKRTAMQKVAKLMIDKYCLILPVPYGYDSMSYQPWVHEAGYMVLYPPSCGLASEEAWMEKH